MDTDRMKKAAQWFYSKVFQDEAIRPRPAASGQKLPPLLRTARSLETGMDGTWQSREALFVKQAKLLAAYEDDYSFEGDVVRYYPTYQSLSDRELRGYFSWRTRLRRGDIQKTSLSFAFLYIYELLNQVGVEDSMEGYRKLTDFRDVYGPIDGRILPYLKNWLQDYVVYYTLDASLLADSPQVLFDRSLTILDNIQIQDDPKVVFTAKSLSPKWLERSKFYKEHSADCDRVITAVLRRVSDHYATRCKKTMIEQYFGPCAEFQVQLFDAAVFYDRQRKRNCEYALDERCIYRCKNGLWTVMKHIYPPLPNTKLGDLLKTVDALMRQEYAYPNPIKAPLETKWILKIIQEETRALLAEKKAAEAKKLTIDYSLLEKIRADAAITREKLTVEEEPEEEIPAAEPPQASPPPEKLQSPLPPEPAGSGLLSPAEYRLLQCLLYGRDYGWVHREGHLLSVLVDSINEKLYDEFMDSVLEDTPEPVEDYIDELKEMVKP